MGSSESKQDWQEEYVSISPHNANPKHLKHKITDQKCQLLSLPIIPQDQGRYIQRLNFRTSENRSKYLTPLLKWQQKKDKMVCGNKQHLDILFGEISPTLDDFLRYRKVISISFTEQQILYVIRNVAYGLKDVQNMKEQHGHVDLTTICITNDVFLKDPMILEEEIKLEPERKSRNSIDGYPSPQKLKSYYDSLSGFEELRGDLFSLGLVALQLYYATQNIKGLYSSPDPKYRNYSINLQALGQKIQSIPFHTLKNAIMILTSFQSKKRLQIYDLLKGVRIDQTRLSMLRQNFPIIAHESSRSSTHLNYPEEKEGGRIAFDNQKIQITSNNVTARPLINTANMSSPQLKSSEILNQPRANIDYHFQPYKPLEFTQSIHYEPFKMTNYDFSRQIEPKSTSPVKFNESNRSENYTSSYMTNSAPQFTQMETSSQNPIFALKKDSVYLPETADKQSIGMTYYPSIQKTEFTYTSKQFSTVDLNPRKSDFEVNTSSTAAYQTSKIPTFEQILNKVRSSDQNSLLNKLPPPSTSTLPQQSRQLEPKSEVPQNNNNLSSGQLENQSQFLSFTAFQQRFKETANQNFPQSASIQGSESTYQENVEKKEEQKQPKQTENDANSAQKKKGQSQTPVQREEKKESQDEQQLKELEKMALQTDDRGQGINQATSTVSAVIPEEPQNQSKSRDSASRKRSGQSYQYISNEINGMKKSSDSIKIQEEEPMSPSQFPQPEEIRLISNKKGESKGSYRSIGSMRSDPKIVVNQPIQFEPVSPLKNGAIFVNEQYEIGTKYEGYMLDGKRHGRGKFFYKEGSYYDGEWKENKMDGYGTLYYPDGRIAYQGEWKDDEFDGKGKVYNDQQRSIDGNFDFTDFNQLDDQWIKYEGDLKNDAKQGFGRLYLTNGDIYQGQFYHDMVHGVGVFKTNNSQKKGIWQQGKLKKLL